MALAITEGVLTTDSLLFYQHSILNDELTQVYDIVVDANNVIGIVESAGVERTKVIVDSATGVNYFIGIRGTDVNDVVYRPVLYVDSFDCVDMCEKLEEIKLLLGGNKWKIV